MKHEKKSMSRKDITIEVIGWLGALMILVGFALNGFEILQSQSYAYQLLNLVGALGAVVTSLHRKVYQTALLNGFWAVIAIFALINVVLGAN